MDLLLSLVLISVQRSVGMQRWSSSIMVNGNKNKLSELLGHLRGLSMNLKSSQPGQVEATVSDSELSAILMLSHHRNLR